MKYPVAGNMFKMQGGVAFIDHLSEKGRAVGYARVDGAWYGPISWNEHGTSDLKKARFNIQDPAFKAGSCIVERPDIPAIKASARPISELLEKLKNDK